MDELLDGGSRPPAPGKRMKKITIAHRWRKDVKNGESTWKCETIKDPELVGVGMLKRRVEESCVSGCVVVLRVRTS